MSFPKATIKRFNDLVNETPGPNAYDPKPIGSKGSGIAAVKSERFSESKNVAATPGPGQYEIDKTLVGCSSGRKRAPKLTRTSSCARSLHTKTSSSNSLISDTDESTLFKTPVSKFKTESIQELKQKCESLSKLLAEATNDHEAAHSNSAVVKQLESDLLQKELELQMSIKKREEVEGQVVQLEEQLEKVRLEATATAEQMADLQMRKGSLEQQIEQSSLALAQERLALDEKSTFLHFTQEQLNSQVEELQGQVKSLTLEVERLNADLGQCRDQLQSEQAKLTELTELYVKENKDAEAAFVQADQDRKQCVQLNEELQKSNDQLRVKLEAAESAIGTLEQQRSELTAQMEDIKTDVEVLNNDKEVLESERKRLEQEKNELALDLMTMAKEKMSLESQMKAHDKEKALLTAQVQELISEKAALEESASAKQLELESCLQQLRQKEEKLKEEMDKHLSSLDEHQQTISSLQSEIRELEMKTSSLEGSLSSSQNEVCNLESENKALLNSFEKVEETIRAYIHRCQDLEIKVEELAAAKHDLNATCVIIEKRLMIAEMEAESKSKLLAEANQQIQDKVVILNELTEQKHSLTMAQGDLTAQLNDAKISHELILNQTKSDLEQAQADRDSAHQELQCLKKEHSRLTNAKEDLSRQVDDGVSTIRRLQEREHELLRRIDLIQQGTIAEVDSRWQAEDEILTLQAENDRLNALLTDAAEKMKSINLDQQARHEDYFKLHCLKEQQDKDLKKLMVEHSLVTAELKRLKQTTEDILRREAELREQLEASEKNARVSKEQVSSLNLSLEAQQQLILEREQRIDELEREFSEGANRIESKFKMYEELLEGYMSDLQELQAKEQECVKQLSQKDEIIAMLRKELNPLQESSQTYKEKYESLLQMIEPFREQLESYEMEKSVLVSENQATKGEMKKLATQYAQLLGHQNHKQKIQHLVRLKEENFSMREQLVKLQLETTKQKRMITRLEADVSKRYHNHTLSAGSDKENNRSIYFTPDVKAMSTPFRRQTIASPLCDLN